MRIDRLVFGTGDRVTGWGWIRESDGAVWFDPPHTVTLIDAGRPAPMSRYAVRLEGADLGAVATDFADDGSIPGWATITGIWREDRIEVETQSPVPPASARRGPYAELTRPPCPPPPGGWPPYDGENLDFDAGDLLRNGAAVMVAQYRPGPGRLALVVAATDTDAVEARLRPQLGPRLCVVPSRWTRDQLDATRAVLHGKWEDWTIETTGESVDEDGQAYVEATLFRVLPELADWSTTLPDDLLRVVPVLVPAA